MGIGNILLAGVVREIKDLHQFFEDWFLGRSGTEDRLLDVLDPEFVLISPSGQRMTRKDVIQAITEANGTHRSIQIWVDEVKVVQLDDSIVLATYQEWQRSPDTITARVSTAVFRVDLTKPNTSRWLHVHETWIKE